MTDSPMRNGCGTQQNPIVRGVSLYNSMFDQGHVLQDLLSQTYEGTGTGVDPFMVQWASNDPADPHCFSRARRWVFTIILALSTLSVALASSAYTGAVPQLVQEYGISSTTAYLGVTLFVMCFAVGPLLWASLSEILGRQAVFIGTFAAFTAFNVGAACSPNIPTLLLCRFFAGAFGSSSLVNTGGVIADLFPSEERNTPMSIFTASLFFGPTLGPIIGSFIGMAEGWRWIQGFIAVMSGVLWIAGSLIIPETYSPVLLRRRARILSAQTGKQYRSKLEETQSPHAVLVKTALVRPWLLLTFEPVVLLISIYLAIVYGILYLLFAAFPLVYHEMRGWTAGIATLPFLAVLVGMVLGVSYSFIHDHRRARAISHSADKTTTAEQRLHPAMVGAIAIPLGLFTFAWTNFPSVHFIVSCIGTALFGFGLVCIFISMSHYLVDSYSIFAASSLAASSVFRSVLGAVFPLFTPRMYETLGIRWASSVPAFLALACIPIPFLLQRHGPWLRSKCRYMIEAREATRVIRS
ncbi:MFS transporter [Aspergillus nomiae NRRL 13137]|uniref:MFS transporter n=1 Tax=Aspergillus nomiae NRRL (strain ATCC 15546 / NRRL 13137 / CBS 260.88 / M93) TaxID=1509407 RepID=A0A0L1IWZ7_ASPN3|nr:MFS transporter [Aspergillus nomiae NRRL 13137]KNG84012.1 MFS transporter [Aspergillus nomiae NRRL 13137]